MEDAVARLVVMYGMPKDPGAFATGGVDMLLFDSAEI
jgi:hypothetical protein